MQLSMSGFVLVICCGFRPVTGRVVRHQSWASSEAEPSNSAMSPRHFWAFDFWGEGEGGDGDRRGDGCGSKLKLEVYAGFSLYLSIDQAAIWVSFPEPQPYVVFQRSLGHVSSGQPCQTLTPPVAAPPAKARIDSAADRMVWAILGTIGPPLEHPFGFNGNLSLWNCLSTVFQGT